MQTAEIIKTTTFPNTINRNSLRSLFFVSNDLPILLSEDFVSYMFASVFFYVY